MDGVFLKDKSNKTLIDRVLIGKDVCTFMMEVIHYIENKKLEKFLCLIERPIENSPTPLYALALLKPMALGAIVLVKEMVPLCSDGFNLMIEDEELLLYRIFKSSTFWLLKAIHKPALQTLEMQINTAVSMSKVAGTRSIDNISFIHEYIEGRSGGINSLISDTSAALHYLIEGVNGLENDGDVKSLYITNKLKIFENDYIKIKNLSIFLGSWNVGNHQPGESLNNWLNLNEKLEEDGIKYYDIYVLGFQEVDMTAESIVLNNSTFPGLWLQHIVNEITIVSKSYELDSSYELVHSKHLGGMLLCIFILDIHKKYISMVESDTISCGIMGLMGNKGGVAISFKLYDSMLCFINCHLASSVNNVDKRNQDYEDIKNKLKFKNGRDNLRTIYQHDFLFWFGDLNYRLEMKREQVIKLIEKKDWNHLNHYDQLINLIEKKIVFYEFNESQINFCPTYKYDVGTNIFDTSEKKRIPSWCDRILFKGEGINDKLYGRSELLTSDHKPVRGVYILAIKEHIKERKKYYLDKIIRELDSFENNNIPDAILSKNNFDFGNIRFEETLKDKFILKNVGKVFVKFKFLPKFDGAYIFPNHIKIKPLGGMILPGEEITFELTLYIDKHSVKKLNEKNGNIDEILILHLENSKDYFISIIGQYKLSFLGFSYEQLVYMKKPVRNGFGSKETIRRDSFSSISLHPLIDNNKRGKNLKASTSGSSLINLSKSSFITPLDVPKELWRIMDYMYKKGLGIKGIFMNSGSPQEIYEIIEDLDKDNSFHKDFSIHSMSTVLLHFLDVTQEPIIPYEYYLDCIQKYNDVEYCKMFPEQILRKYKINYNIFNYLISFLIEILKHSKSNKMSMEKISLIFGNFFLQTTRQLPVNDLWKEKLLLKKAHFLINFL